jgi:flavin reductase (DIM6/NTAB) family NADH-FMN oxidoreductase RutF
MTAAQTPVPTDPAPVGAAELRQFMRGWPTGVAVVTGSWGRQPVGCTANSLISVSLHPPTLLVSLTRNSRTLTAIAATKTFGVNLLGWRQAYLAERFATGGVDRFANVAYRLDNGVPVLEKAMAATVCAVQRTVDAADHVLVFGSPLWCARGDAEPPTIFFDGRFHALPRYAE